MTGKRVVRYKKNFKEEGTKYPKSNVGGRVGITPRYRRAQESGEMGDPASPTAPPPAASMPQSTRRSTHCGQP